MYLEKPLKKYIDDLAAKIPAPGGGSAAALTSATGFALVSMVCNFTLGNEKFKDVWHEIQTIHQTSEKLRVAMMDLIDEDCCVYLKVSKAFKMPKDTPSQKQRRRIAIEAALKDALIVPLEICKLSNQGMTLCRTLIDIGNPNLISDVGVAVSLFNAAFESAILNVQINLNGISDKEYIDSVKCIIEPIYLEISHSKEMLYQKTQKRLEVTI